ncbi:MAG: uracil-DNA glycosylase [bacterium]
MSSHHPAKNCPPFSEAIATALPILQGMKRNLRGAPTASRSSLERLLTATHLPDGKNSAFKNQPSVKTIPVSPPPISQTPSPASPDDGRLAKLEELKHNILSCTRCPNLVASRTQVVYGVGNPFTELLFVGEAPGEEEDLRGEPFVGKAGQLLTKIIGAMDYTREDIFIANILKCRPDMPAGVSGNRKPKPAEMATCLSWLTQQIDLIKPKVIVALGLTAVEGLLGEPRTMRDVRGKWLDYHGVPLMPTYHPAYLLRNQTLAEKRKVWEDMLLVLEQLGRPISAKQRGYFLEKE